MTVAEPGGGGQGGRDDTPGQLRHKNFGAPLGLRPRPRWGLPTQTPLLIGVWGEAPIVSAPPPPPPGYATANVRIGIVVNIGERPAGGLLVSSYNYHESNNLRVRHYTEPSNLSL